MGIIIPSSSPGGYSYQPTDKQLDPFKSSDLDLKCALLRDMVVRSFGKGPVSIRDVYDWLSSGADDGRKRGQSIDSTKEILELCAKQGFFTRKIVRKGG